MRTFLIYRKVNTKKTHSTNITRQFTPSPSFVGSYGGTSSSFVGSCEDQSSSLVGWCGDPSGSIVGSHGDPSAFMVRSHGDPTVTTVVSNGDPYGILGELYGDPYGALVGSHGDSCGILVGSSADPYGTFYRSRSSCGHPCGIFYRSQGSYGDHMEYLWNVRSHGDLQEKLEYGDPLVSLVDHRDPHSSSVGSDADPHHYYVGLVGPLWLIDRWEFFSSLVQLTHVTL